MSKYTRLLSNTAILGAGTFVSKVLVFLLMPLYTALLSTEQFGTADLLMQTANLIMPLAILGIGDGLFRFALDADRDKKREVFSNALKVIAFGILPLVLFVQIFNLFAIYRSYVWLLIFYVFSANLHLICANYIRACNKTKIFAIQGIVNTALTILLNVLFLLVFDMGVLGYVLSVAASDLVITIGLFFSCKLYRDVTFKVTDRTLLPSMLKFSVPYIPTTIMWMITSASDRFIVTAFSGAAENGLYAAAYKLPTLITLAGGVFMEAWQFSSVSDATPDERGKFFATVYRNYLGIMFIGGSALVVGSKILTALLLDESYYSSWQYVSVLGVAMIFSALSSFIGSIYFIEKRSVRSFITAGVGAITNLVLNFLLIPFYGAMGAAIATAISYIVAFSIRCIDTAKYMRFDLCVFRLVANFIILMAQAVIMILELKYWIAIEVVLFIIMLVLNGREMLNTAITLAKKFLSKK